MGSANDERYLDLRQFLVEIKDEDKYHFSAEQIDDSSMCENVSLYLCDYADHFCSKD